LAILLTNKSTPAASAVALRQAPIGRHFQDRGFLRTDFGRAPTIPDAE